MDYSFNKEAFDVLASFSGEVSDVKEDNIFGKSVTITSKDLSITYQSLSDITVKRAIRSIRRIPIAKAGSNIYKQGAGQSSAYRRREKRQDYRSGADVRQNER